VRTRWRVFWLIALTVLVILFALTARLFVWPQTNVPRRAGAIVVLGSDTADDVRRVAEGEKLFKAGDAPLLAISTDQRCPASGTTRRVICFSPSPVTTQGEARFIGLLARKDHLSSVIVVAGRPQATRARLRVERCFTGSIEVVGVDPRSLEQWLYQIAYEWGATLKALTIQRGC
jgi:hypothetical protein